ncbi:glycoside hydrolase family 26 protein [Paenibacillus sp. NPDC056579]|uniref:glycoside hydrolase family 26 protein n=1 Tax=Paenibacillus sp. NPDC056579 TaxID=3345871 RepID=UPI0036B29656
MNWKFPLFRAGLVAVCSMLLIVLIPSPYSSKEEEPPESPELVEWWKEQADAAERSNQPDIAAIYKSRLDGYAASLKQPPSLSVNSGSLQPAADSFETARWFKRSELPSTAKTEPLAKFEPVSGTYLGMLGADRRVSYDVTKVDDVYGRTHAMYLAYVGWRKFQTDTNSYFPIRQAERVKQIGGALQIGWEPRFGLEDVQDDEYVRTFAREAKASGIPVFLRYASEMNGAWVPWHGNPELYIEKFRLIHKIMKEEAPNVVMVWSPNFAPANNIEEYYPGDDYVDWVGFSLYATPLSNGKEQLKGSLIDTFAPLYAKYSHKPIMISEGAVAHTVLTTETAYLPWAEGQLSYMYAVLPRIYPKVKAITYFNFSRAQAVRNKMEYVYDLGENPLTDALYKRLIRSDWYLDSVAEAKTPPDYTYLPVQPETVGAGSHRLLFHGELASGNVPFAVELSRGDRRLDISYQMPWEMTLDAAEGSAAKEPLKITAYNEKMEPVAVHTWAK